MVDGLDGLGHNVVVGGNDNDTEVGYLGSAGTHGGKGFVARSVEKCDTASVFKFYVVCADVLCYAACFACDYVGVADIVEERCLTVVDVAHYGYNRRTVDEVFLVVFFLMDCLDYLGRYIFGLEPELFGYNIDSLGVEALVDGYHHTEIHTSGDDLIDGNIHHYGQVVGCNEFGEFQHTAFGCFGFGRLAFA